LVVLYVQRLEATERFYVDTKDSLAERNYWSFKRPSARRASSVGYVGAQSKGDDAEKQKN